MNGPGELRRHSALRDARHFTATAWRRSAVAGLALLAGLVCLATTAAARADFATRTRALHATIDAAPPTTAMVTATSDWGTFTQSLGAKVSEIEYAGARMRAQLASTLPLAEPAAASWSTLEVPERAVLAPPSAYQAGGVGAQMRLIYRDTYQNESRLLSGRRPTDNQDPKAPLEADLSSATAAKLGLGVGALLTIQSPDKRGTTVLRIVGLVAPRESGSVFWTSDPIQLAPQLESGAGLNANVYWATDALIGPAQVTALITPSSAAVDEGNATAPGDFRVSWDFPLDLSGLNADGAGPLADQLDAMAALEYSLAYDPDRSIPATFNTQLTPILRAFVAAQQVTALEQAMPLYGLALIAAIAGALLTYAAVDRRRLETGVLRARGAATWYLTLHALAESCVTVLPAAAVGVALGTAVPGLSPAWLRMIIVVTAVSATVAPALYTALVYRPRRSARAPSTSRARPTRFARHRRLIVQGALAAGCLAGIDLVRGQGLTPGGGVDPYAAAAPVLAAALAALLAVNLLPLALRGLRRRALSRRGVVALLGVARAAYEPGTGQAATFVLAIAACTADLSVSLAQLARQSASGPLGHAATATLDALAVLAVVTAGAVAALAVRLGAASRRAADRRLATMGMTTGQARAIAALENAPPALAGALTGALATVPLLRIVAPALGVAVVPSSAGSLVLPALAVALPAAAASVAGSWRRGAS